MFPPQIPKPYYSLYLKTVYDNSKRIFQLFFFPYMHKATLTLSDYDAKYNIQEEIVRPEVESVKYSRVCDLHSHGCLKKQESFNKNKRLLSTFFVYRCNHLIHFDKINQNNTPKEVLEKSFINTYKVLTNSIAILLTTIATFVPDDILMSVLICVFAEFLFTYFVMFAACFVLFIPSYLFACLYTLRHASSYQKQQTKSPVI